MEVKRRVPAPTQAYRWRLVPHTQRLGSLPSGAFLRQMRSMDPDLEILWWAPMSIWILFRVVGRGVVKGEDLLKKEVEVRGENGECREPGQWLIDWLKRNDLCYRYKTRDPERARRLWVEEMMAQPSPAELAAPGIDDISQAWAEDAWFAVRGRHSNTFQNLDQRDAKRERHKRRMRAIHGNETLSTDSSDGGGGS